MESQDDDEDTDLKLVRASAGLLSDLESALPKVLWRRAESGSSHGRVHARVKQQDLDYIVKLVRSQSTSMAA